MPAPKGHKKFGGRVAGTPNKRTQALIDVCEKKGLNPFEAMIDMAKNALDESLRFQALKELCQYLYPKRKAIEHSGSLDSNIKIEEHKIELKARVEQIIEGRGSNKK